MNPILFVSLGPGEPELITVKGLKALQAADCIFCPETQTRDGRTLSRAAGIMQQLDIPNSSIRHVVIYFGDGTYVHSTDGKGNGVTVTNLNSGYSANTYVTARRIF